MNNLGLYMFIVTLVVLLSSGALAYCLRKTGLLNLYTLAAVTFSSIAVCVVFPYSWVMVERAGKAFPLMKVFLPVIMIVVYLTLLILFTVLVSIIVPEKKAISINKILAGRLTKNDDILPQKNSAYVVENKDDAEAGGKIIFEKSVDSKQNIDTMCIESNIAENESIVETLEDAPDTVPLQISNSVVDQPDIECYIDRAFNLKSGGKLQEAVQCYMDALEQSPDKDLVFWIVLDICVIYKTLGQTELAREILDSYITVYGDIMEASVKDEILRNL
ncbi:MAG: tetratricopeptide repeat protein [Clostridia bacterium]|nr:tetratricopeptide repeat protein [Clostridia bacterium]